MPVLKMRDIGAKDVGQLVSVKASSTFRIDIDSSHKAYSHLEHVSTWEGQVPSAVMRSPVFEAGRFKAGTV